MAMKKLSVDLQSLISSSLQINSFKRVVEELVYNSLDAKATSIAVRMNVSENKIQVIDNGCGITENDFDILGKKYSTSKCVDLNTLKSVPHAYGFRGQFLSNLISVAQKVKITSRFEKGEDTWVKIFYNGKERELAKTTIRPSVGTTVEVSGLFYNLHIQSKNMESLNELFEIKTFLKQLTLVHSNVSISLRDDAKNEIIFKAHKNRSIYQTFGLLFNVNEKDIEEFKVEKKEYKVTAYFGKKYKDVGDYHWIYLNGTFLNSCKLHKIVNDHLSKSCNHISRRKTKTKTYEEEDMSTKSNIPFYVILLSCPYYDYDIHDLSKRTSLEFKNWEDITNLLKKLVKFYSGDEILKKQSKLETINTNHAITKDNDTRDQVRKIVEKLLKSNSRKLGVSQMKNGVKGKLTKRNKKKIKKSLNISVSKVIPSKNKMTRIQNDVFDNKSIETETGGKNDHDSSKIETIEKENENKNVGTIINEEYHNSEVPQLKLNKKENVYDIRAKERYNNNNRKYEVSSKHTTGPNEQFHFRKDRSRTFFDDTCKRIDFGKNRMKYKHKNTMRSRQHMTNYKQEKEKVQEENDVTTFCNIKNSNTQITIRENIEEIIVYDYIPHPLNSNPDLDQQKRLKKKQHISSRDLVKTILNTQQNMSTNHKNSSHNQEIYVPEKQSKTAFNFAKFSTPKPFIEQDRKTISQNTRDLTLNGLNFDLHSNSNITNRVPGDDMFVSRMTFESHHYDKHMYQDNNRKTICRKFISTYSKENLNISKEKQKAKQILKKKFKRVPKNHFHDFNISLGIKNFFKGRKSIQESSLMIEFSNTNDKENTTEGTFINYLQNTNNIFNNFFVSNVNTWMQNSNLERDWAKGPSTSVKNTYTISSNSSNVRETYTVSCQNNESIRYEGNDFQDLQETYTIETHNDNYLYPRKNSKEMNNDETTKEDIRKDRDGLNVIFVSEPQLEINESSADKIIEPVTVCETIFTNSNSSKSISNMEIDLNHDIAQQCSTPQKSNTETPKDTLTEISHHFNGQINNKKYSSELNNPRDVSNTELNEKHCSTVDINVNNLTDNIRLINGLEVSQKLPNDTDRNNFNIKIRPRYMPKGMSQIFENSNTKGICDYKLDDDYFKCNIYNDFNKDIQVNTEIFKPTMQNAKEDATKAIEKVNLKLRKENSSLTFNGQLLKQAQILDQVDGKFIAAVLKSKSESDDYLVLFDQHAVHERIRLENNMSDYFNDHQWKSVELDVFTLKLNKEEIIYLHNYKDKFYQLGLEWNIQSDYEISVSSIPEAILGKNPRPVEKVVTAVKNLILEEINILKSQGGCISLHPKSIMDLVFSEACRYAIKFGDTLTKNECTELIKSLSDCKTPFQCAHGRPVMAVITEIACLDVPEYKIDVSNIRSFRNSLQKQALNK